jgi:hypothetical protein
MDHHESDSDSRRSNLHGPCLPAQAQETAAPPPPLPFDSPVTMRDMEAVCTGIGADARTDPRWPTYPLRIKLVGRAGGYREALVTVSKGGEAVIGARCGGHGSAEAAPGAYDVTAEVEGRTMMSRERGRDGQARVVLRFPDLGQPLQ